MKFLLSLIATIIFVFPASADQNGVITVMGEGRVDVVPDMATISLGVQHRAETAKRALAMVGRDIDKVTKGLAKFGISDRDIQTSHVSLHQVYDHRSNTGQPPKVIGFSGSNQLSVVVRDLDQIAEILDGIFDAGANNFNGISFGSSSPEAALKQARAMAVVDGLDRAATYADAASIELGPILEISESGPSVSPMPMMAAEMRMADSAPISPGTNTLIVQIWIKIRTETR